MALHNGADGCEPQSCSLVDFLGRKKRLKDFLQDARRDAGSRIGEGDENVRAAFCVGIQSWSGRVVVSTVDRNAHRRFDSLHGPRKHCRRQYRAPMDDHFRFRPRSRIRIFIRASRDAAIRGLAPADVVVVL